MCQFFPHLVQNRCSMSSSTEISWTLKMGLGGIGEEHGCCNVTQQIFFNHMIAFLSGLKCMFLFAVSECCGICCRTREFI